MENSNLVYGVKDRPNFGKVLVFALQQLLAILAATIVVPVIINGNVAKLFDKGQVYIDDVLSSVSQNEIEFTTASTNNHANLALFTNYEWTDNNYPSPHGETQNRNQKFRIYACKIYDENGVKIREFIPCYRKSDSVIGMYDTINQTFYTNAGTGAFTKGSDI